MTAEDQIPDQLRAGLAELGNSIVEQARSMVPGWPGLPPKSREELAAERAALLATARDEHAKAVAEWTALHEHLPPGTRLGTMSVALLELHQPELQTFDGTLHCSHCMECSYDGGAAEWPCKTYTTIRDALNGES